MKRLIVIIIALAIVIPITAGAATNLYDNDFLGWAQAIGNTYNTEDFSDKILNPGLTVITDNGYIDTTYGYWYDILTYDTVNMIPLTFTTWGFSEPILAFGGTWNLGVPGGPGSNIEVLTLDGSWETVGVIDRNSIDVFWGFVSDVPFTQVRLQAYNNDGVQETYTLDDMVYSYPMENYVTGGCNLKDEAPYSSASGNVGFVEGFGIVGNFELKTKGGKTSKSISYHSKDFEFLYFTGGEATSPTANHNTVVFKGNFTNNRDDTVLSLWIKIIDNGEGKKKAIDQIGFSSDGGSFDMYDLSGGNFQVHNK